MSQKARAMILDLGGGLRAAVGRDEMMQLVMAVPVSVIPRTPYYCCHALVWMERAVPLMDLRAFLLQRDAEALHKVPLAAIVAWQQAPRQPLHYVAFRIHTPPQIVEVHDDQGCELPQDNPRWAELAHACFAQGGSPVPILDLTHICSGALSASDRLVPSLHTEAVG